MSVSRLYIKAKPGSVIKIGSTTIYVLGQQPAPVCIEADSKLPVEYLSPHQVERLIGGKKLS